MRCYTSVPKTLGLAVLGVLMMAMSYLLTQSSDLFHKAIGWLGVAFFGAALLAILFQLFRRRPTVIIDDSGVMDTRLGVGYIAWEDIASISVADIHRQRFISLWLRDEAKFLSRTSRSKRLLRRANRALGFSPFSLSFAGLSPGLNEVYDVLRSRLPERAGV